MLSSLPDAPTLRTLFDDRSWPEGGLPSPVPFRGQSVLITGAGGSLGRRLVRAFCRLQVREIVAVDASEHTLVRLRSGLREELAVEDRDVPALEFVLGDLRRASDRRRSLAYEPDIVVHAAAYKHVPFLEEQPIAAVENNLLATIDWAQECRRAGIDRFVFVSTDKVVAPTSVMGRTKQLGEQWLRLSRGTSGGQALSPPSTTIRLCNLFGSRGSVLPRFLRRLEAEEPVPLTHPDMHRWFVASKDASGALLGALAESPGTYIPTACLYVSISTLAHRLVRWRYPGADTEEWIRRVGPRPGERLHEALWEDGEDVRRGGGRGLLRVTGAAPPSSLLRRIEELRQACAADDAGAVQRLLCTENEEKVPTSPPPSFEAAVQE